jgi:hypothetical protein
MALYRFLGKGPAYGLGYTEGELIEIKDGEGLVAKCKVPEIYADGKNKGQNTGKMVMADKKYSVDYLIESGVIAPARTEDRNAWKNGEHINAIADKMAATTAKLEKEQKDARLATLAGK